MNSDYLAVAIFVFILSFSAFLIYLGISQLITIIINVFNHKTHDQKKSSTIFKNRQNFDFFKKNRGGVFFLKLDIV